MSGVLGRVSVTRLVAALALLTVMVGMGAAASAQPTGSAAPAGACAGVGRDGAWTRLVPPRFTTGVARISSYAVSATGEWVYVTNGVVVLRSGDLGCVWRSVYTVSAGSTTSRSTVTAIVTPPAPDPSTRPGGTVDSTVYLAVQQALGATGVASTALVAASTDAGAHWAAGAGLPGTTLMTAAGGNDPRVLYALVAQPRVLEPVTQTTVGTGELLARSGDSGAHWAVQQLSGPSVSNATLGTAANTTTPFTGLSVDPGDAQHLWLFGPTGLNESTDGGATVTAVTSPFTAWGVSLATAGRSTSGRAQLVIDLPRLNAVSYTSPGANNPDQLSLLAAGSASDPVSSVLPGPQPGEFAVGTARHVYLHLPPSATGFTAVSPLLEVSPGSARLTELRTVSSGRRFTVYGRTADTVETRVMPGSFPRLPGPVLWRQQQQGGPQYTTVNLLNAQGGMGLPAITPGRARVTLNQGRQRSVPYSLLLPGSRKVDVYFLVDATNSMSNKIAALQQALGRIVNALTGSHVDPWFGLGIFRSYSTPPAYQRLVDLAPSGPALQAAIDGLRAQGGKDETQLDGLFQAATGAGLNVPTQAAFIAAGQQADWRADALHIVLNITDEGFRTGGPHPSFPQTVAALRAVHALQVGVAYQTNNPTTNAVMQAEGEVWNPAPSVGLTAVAEGTGALAPPEGASCTGSGAPDIAPGAPLVCIIDPSQAAAAAALAPAIVNMVLAAPDITPVTVSYSARRPVVAGVNPRVAPAVNLRFPTLLGFTVTYTCPDTLPAAAYPVTLTARVRGAVVASASAVVTCRAGALAAVLTGPVLGLGAVSLAAPPAEPVSNAQPQSQPQSQPQNQPQSQQQAQGASGLVFAEQENPQFAFAYVNPAAAQADGERVLAFTRYQPMPPADPSPWPGTTAALTVASAAGLGLLRTRRRTQLIPASIRRSPTRRATTRPGSQP